MHHNDTHTCYVGCNAILHYSTEQLQIYYKESSLFLLLNLQLYPPVQQWSRNYKFITPRTGQEDPASQGDFLPFDSFLMIAIEQSQQSGLRLDGSPLPNPTWVELKTGG